MTRQIPDRIKIRKKEYDIAAATDFNNLLDIKKFGFEPKTMHTGCWKGFYVDFIVDDGILKLNSLTILDKNGYYPKINDVEAKTTRWAKGELEKHLSHIKEYDNINLDIDYTGHIYVADIEYNLRISWTDNIPFDRCENIKDLYFENGVLISISDVK